MDCGSRTKNLIIAALLWAPLTCAWAQDNDEPAVATGTVDEGTSIFGNQELPKGLTIVPWQKSDPGQLSERPTRLVDEPLAPIDPDVFERRLKYYEQARGE